MAGSRFVQINVAELTELRDDPRALQVWASLLKYADWETMKCHPSKKRLASDCGCSVDCVERALKRLGQRGLLEIRQRRNPKGDNDTNEYQLLRKHECEGGAQVRPPMGTDAPTGGARERRRRGNGAPQNENQRSRPNKQEPLNDGHVVFLEEEKSEALRHTKRLFKALATNGRYKRIFGLNLKDYIAGIAILLTRGRLSENDIERSLEPVTYKRRNYPANYFHATLLDSLPPELNLEQELHAALPPRRTS